jgi:hypothetical protein
MFYWQFSDEGDNLLDDSNINKVEEDNRLSFCLKQVVSQSTTHDNRKYIVNPILIWFHNCIFKPEIML